MWYNIYIYIYIHIIYLYITEVFGAGALGPPPTTHGGTPPFFMSRSCLESTTFSGVPLESSKCSLPPKLNEKSSQTSPQSPPNHTQMDLGGPFKTCGICDVFVTLGYMEGDWTSIWLPLAFRAHTFCVSSASSRNLGQNHAPKMSAHFPHIYLKWQLSWPREA